MKRYQAELAQYHQQMDQRDRDMKAAGAQIAQQEADYQRAERESNTSLFDILLQVGVAMLLDMIGYTAVVGCLGGSVWDCVDLASNFLGPLKAFKLARTIINTIDRALSGFRMWKRIVEGARTAMRRAQDLMSQARKTLADVTKKLPKKPKVPKKKPKPPVKKKPKLKPKPKPKPQVSKPAKPPRPKNEAKKADKPSNTKPQKPRDRSRDRDRDAGRSTDRDRNRDNDGAGEQQPQAASCRGEQVPKHSFDPATLVLMADGSTRAIADVEVGDTVLAEDPVTGEAGPRQVTLLHANRDFELTDVTVSDRPAGSAQRAVEDQGEGKGGRSTRGPTGSVVLHTTAHHPFWDASAGEWVDAAELVPGTSTLVGPDGQLQYVTDVDNFADAKVMRDLTVADIHTYYVLAGNAPVLVHNCDHVVLGVNPHSDDLAAGLQAAGDSKAHTFNGNEYGGPGTSGRPKWMEGVEKAIGDPSTKISVTLDGLPGSTPLEAFGNAYRRGVPLQGSWQKAARSGNGTAWELAKLGNKVRFGDRRWSDIDFYHDGQKLVDFAEPDWVALRRGL